jgi:hypothetical protein
VPGDQEPASDAPRRSREIRHALRAAILGRPLRASEATGEEISTLTGLPALSLDALTSVAYGPEAIMVVLATAGLSALHLVLPVTIVIVVLLAILVTSYRQVIDGYPEGGGCYAVSKENLGRGFSLLAAAALIVDYTSPSPSPSPRAWRHSSRPSRALHRSRSGSALGSLSW